MLENFVHTVFGLTLLTNAIAFIPQMLRLIKTKDPNSLSLTTFLLFNFGQVFSIWHGLYTKDYIFVIGTAVTLITCATTTGLIIFYKLKAKR